MTKLLLATDHCFESFNSQIYDRYGFGLDFFSDYLSVFYEVHVLARVEVVQELSPNSILSCNERIIFHPLPRLFGINWMLKSKNLIAQKLRVILDNIDCIICRVPSQTGYWAAKEAHKNNIPFMIEVIGDPKSAVSGINNFNPILRIIAESETLKLKKVAANANVASYVNKSILPILYPAPKAAKQDIISSIRLQENSIVSKKKNFPSNPVKLINIASLVPIKRHNDIIKCAEILYKSGLKFEIHLIGGGGLQKKLEELASKLGVRKNFIFHGHLSSRDKINQLLEASTMFIFSSSSEGLPRSIIESMAKGLPVISTDVGGIPELIPSKYLVSKKDYEGLANKILKAINEPKELKAMSEENIIQAKAYSRDVLFEKRRQLYTVLSNIKAKS